MDCGTWFVALLEIMQFSALDLLQQLQHQEQHNSRRQC